LQAAPINADGSGLAKNVMVFISDGASWGTFDMASYWEFGEKGRQPYDDFDVKLGMTTEPAGAPDYDPAAAWDTTPTGDDDHFEGYKTIKQNTTDSAAAGTALATGEKTFNGRIDFDTEGKPLPFISQDMKAAGKATGAVSSVMFSHATPATFGSQNISRGNRQEIAAQMINEGSLDLIMGAGHPQYDDDGKLRATPSFSNISEADWNALNGPDAPMHLVETKAEFEALADGSLTVDGRLIGIPQVGGTLQANRDPVTTPLDPAAPGSPNLGFPEGHVLLETTPTLETMTKGALNHLGKDDDGLFLMVEGGAVDWMAHANATGRVIEEQIDFNHAVGAAADWIDVNSSWDETMMIVLTDHGNGMPMGPDSDTIPFQPIQNNGKGVLPGVKWHSGSHTTENTLLWAHGAGSELFYEYVTGTDSGLTDILGFNDGSYIENQSVNAVMARAAGIQPAPAPVPLPASMWLLGSALALLAAGRRMARGW
jgi:alkaline phosphatase